jgi:hypothetical protein
LGSSPTGLTCEKPVFLDKNEDSGFFFASTGWPQDCLFCLIWVQSAHRARTNLEVRVSMAGRQKTREAANIKKAAINRDAQEFFQFRLSCVDNLQEAKKLAGHGSTQNQVSQQYYANLAIFVDSEFRQLPPRVSSFEKQLYSELIGRLTAGGELKEGARAEIDALLKIPTPKAVGRTMADRVSGK